MAQLMAAYLVNAAWQVPLVALVAWAAARCAGLAPAARHRLWLAFLAAAVVLPAIPLQALLPHATPTVAATALPDAPAIVVPAPAAPLAAEPAVALPPMAVWAMAALSAVAALAILARLAVAGAAARRLVRDAWPAELPQAATRAVADLCAARGRRTPAILRSAAVSSPAVVGAWRPVILIPQDLACDAETLTAALLHETAHVLRGDYAANLACELASLPLAWHPARLALSAGVRRSRELACDAMAAAALGSQATYAKRLVALAQRLGNPLQPARGGATDAALAVGLFGRSDLEERLMHLMTPREREAPALRAARLSGLAAVGVGLLGSAALLHVTPVLAQPATAAAARAPVSAAPLPAPAAASAARDPERDAAKPAPTPRHHHARTMVTDNGVLITSGEPGEHPHSWTAANGRTMTVYTDDAAEPSAEQKRQWEEKADRAEARAREALQRVNSPEFKAKIARATEDAVKAADIEGYVNSPEFKAKIAAATARAADVQKMVDSPEFKARIAAATARAADVEKMVNSPEFKARIARAQAAAQAAAERLSHEFDDLDDAGGGARSKATP
jgi:beta-lactamase regulating signal transducer with metallopeptidase domain